MAQHPALPGLHDRRWRRAPMAGGASETPYLPFGPPFVPSMSAATSWLEEGAQMVLLPDGYPARLVAGFITAHPMHGRYVLEDLLRRFTAAPSDGIRTAMHMTADAIVGRAERTGDWLLMWYEPHLASAMARRRRHTSGLPQAYYAALLARVGMATGAPRFLDAADRFFAPLAVPVPDGGLLHIGPPGPTLAMAPIAPRDWVLNGWLSMLVAADDYGRRRQHSVVSELMSSNLATLEAILPAFDAPNQLLSRYTLVGMLMVKIELSGAWADVRFRNTRVRIPDEPDDVNVELTAEAGWTPRWYSADVKPESNADAIIPLSRTPRMVLQLSRAPVPRPNQLRFTIDAPKGFTLKLHAFVGSFDPLRSSMVDRAWIEIDRQDVGSGNSEVSLDVPYERVDLFSYPTNFGKRFDGRPTNTYHATHIVRLRQLAAISRSSELAQWAERWRAYVDDWPSIAAYRGFRCWSPEGAI